MRILTIGGTRFFGRAFVEEAARRGHEVSVFHRGESEPAELAGIEHLHGDRKAGVDALGGRSWDAVLDTCAFVPREVRDARGDDRRPDRPLHAGVVALGASRRSAGRRRRGHADIPAAVSGHGGGDRGDVRTAEGRVRGRGRGTVRRTAPRDPARLHRGAARPHRPLHLVGAAGGRRRRDARRRAAGRADPGDRRAGPRHVRPRSDRGTRHGHLRRRRTRGAGDDGRHRRGGSAAAGADTSFVWADPDFVLGLGEIHETWFPMWHPHLPGFHAYDAAKATAAGLRPRPFDETIADTLAWDRDRGAPPLAGGHGRRSEERELLAEWRLRAG